MWNNMNVIGDRILVKPKKGDYLAKLGLDGKPELIVKRGLTGQNAANVMLSEVLSVGEGGVTSSGVLLPVRVKEGDTVLTPASATAKFTFDNIDYGIVRECDIWLVLSKEDVAKFDDDISDKTRKFEQ